jgi:hypothetical protein
VYKRINIYEFQDAFRQANREDNFSYEGLRKLFEYLTDYEEQCDMELGLDVISLCCDYVEYSHEEALKQYCDYASIDEIRTSTTVIDVDGNTVIIEAF